jgi:hypothetical protein
MSDEELIAIVQQSAEIINQPALEADSPTLMRPRSSEDPTQAGSPASDLRAPCFLEPIAVLDHGHLAERILAQELRRPVRAGAKIHPVV